MLPNHLHLTDCLAVDLNTIQKSADSLLIKQLICALLVALGGQFLKDKEPKVKDNLVCRNYFDTPTT